jgi:hypothetical protein
MAKYIEKPESEETPEDEMKESPEMQAKEAAEGIEEHDTETGEPLGDKGAEESVEGEGQDPKIEEEFQQEVTPIIESATLSQLEFMNDMVSSRLKELNKSQTKEEKASVFDMEGMEE